MNNFFVHYSLLAPLALTGLFFVCCLVFFVLAQKYIWPYVLPFLKIIAADPWSYLHRLPVNPLIIKATQAEFFDRRAFFSPYKKYFSYRSVLRYKEFSWWIACLITIYAFFILPVDQAIIISCITILCAFRWPEWFLLKQDKELKRRAERELSNIIDLLRLFVSAGQNLEQAVRHIASPHNGWWGDFFIHLTTQLDAGQNFDRVLTDSAERLDSPDYRRFVVALKQAQTLGVPLSATLSVQATLLRSRRRQLAETAARKASVKIALPLALCIFPALLIIYLTPAVLRLFNDL